MKIGFNNRAWQTFCLPSRRHCRNIPPDDIFFSDSISVNPRELANINTSTRLVNRWRNATEASIDNP